METLFNDVIFNFERTDLHIRAAANPKHFVISIRDKTAGYHFKIDPETEKLAYKIAN